MRKPTIQFYLVIVMLICMAIIPLWIIYSIWVDVNPEWVNNTGQSAIVIGIVSYLVAKSFDELSN